MSFLGIRLPSLSNVLPLLSTAAPFIPGIGPMAKLGIMGAGALLGGAKDDRTARNLYSQQAGGYQDLLGQGQANSQQYQQYMAPMLQQYQSIINNGGIPNFDARYRSSIEGQAPEFDNAVHNAFMDFGDRGLGVDSTGLEGAVGNLRARQAQAGLNMRRDLIGQGITNRTNMLQQGIPMLNGMMQGNNQLQMQALSGLGGVGGMYGSKAQGAMGSLGQLGSMLPQILQMGSGKNPNAGSNTLDTNQSGAAYNLDPTLGNPWGNGQQSIPMMQNGRRTA